MHSLYGSYNTHTLNYNIMGSDKIFMFDNPAAGESAGIMSIRLGTCFKTSDTYKVASIPFALVFKLSEKLAP